MYLSIGLLLAVIVVLFSLGVIIIEAIHATKCHINDVEYKHSLTDIHKSVDELGYPDFNRYSYSDFSDIALGYIFFGVIITGFLTLVLWPLAVIYLVFTQTVKHLRDIKRLKKDLDKKCEEE